MIRGTNVEEKSKNRITVPAEMVRLIRKNNQPYLFLWEGDKGFYMLSALPLPGKGLKVDKNGEVRFRVHKAKRNSSKIQLSDVREKNWKNTWEIWQESPYELHIYQKEE